MALYIIDIDVNGYWYFSMGIGILACICKCSMDDIKKYYYILPYYFEIKEMRFEIGVMLI